MAQKEFILDTRQLDALSGELAAMPKDVLSAMRSSLVTGVRSSLTKEASSHYAIDPKTMGGTFRVFTRRTETPSSTGIQFEVSGRRLTLSHFRFSPQRSGSAFPLVEVIQGGVKRASGRVGEDGKRKPPFVMKTGAKSDGKVPFNVFVRTGRRQNNGRRESLRGYRTVSAPQMLGNDVVAEGIQDNLLRVFNRNLMKRIETRTGLMQQNIRKEGK